MNSRVGFTWPAFPQLQDHPAVMLPEIRQKSKPKSFLTRAKSQLMCSLSPLSARFSAWARALCAGRSLPIVPTDPNGYGVGQHPCNIGNFPKLGFKLVCSLIHTDGDSHSGDML